MSKEEWVDPIVEEVRRIRDEHAASFNYDLRAIVADLQKRQASSDRPVVSFPPRRPEAPPREGAA